MTRVAKRLTPLVFLERAQAEVKAARFTLRLQPGNATVNGWHGYTDPNRRRITVMVGEPTWLVVLAHELEHLRQHVRDDPRYWAADERTLKRLGPLHMRSGFPARTKAFEASCVASAQIEHDAERRAIADAKRYGLLPNRVALSQYTREANLYVWSHYVLRSTGVWLLDADQDDLSHRLPDRLLTLAQLKKLGLGRGEGRKT